MGALRRRSRAVAGEEVCAGPLSSTTETTARPAATTHHIQTYSMTSLPFQSQTKHVARPLTHGTQAGGRHLGTADGQPGPAGGLSTLCRRGPTMHTHQIQPTIGLRNDGYAWSPDLQVAPQHDKLVASPLLDEAVAKEESDCGGCPGRRCRAGSRCHARGPHRRGARGPPTVLILRGGQGPR